MERGWNNINGNFVHALIVISFKVYDGYTEIKKINLEKYQYCKCTFMYVRAKYD